MLKLFVKATPRVSWSGSIRIGARSIFSARVKVPEASGRGVVAGAAGWSPFEIEPAGGTPPILSRFSYGRGRSGRTINQNVVAATIPQIAPTGTNAGAMLQKCPERKSMPAESRS